MNTHTAAQLGLAPFDFPGDQRGVLLLHGFGGCPLSMRDVGLRLAGRGLTVVGPAIAGHNLGPEELDATSWHDWLADVNAQLAALERRCTRVAVVGLSMGGLLALRIALEQPGRLAAVGALATPVHFGRARTLAIETLGRLSNFVRIPHVPKIGGADIFDGTMRRLDVGIPVHPARAVYSLLELSRLVRADLELLRTPLFVAHGRRDHVAPYSAAEELVRRAGSPGVKLLTLDRSFHVITLDVERELLAEELGGFLAERMS